MSSCFNQIEFAQKKFSAAQWNLLSREPVKNLRGTKFGNPIEISNFTQR